MIIDSKCRMEKLGWSLQEKDDVKCAVVNNPCWKF